MLSKGVAETFKKYGVSLGSRVVVNSRCSMQTLESLQKLSRQQLIPAWHPRLSLASLAEHMTDFVVTEDDSSASTAAALCKSLGIYHLPTGLDVPDMQPSPHPENSQIVLQVNSGHRCVQLSQDQLQAQVANLRELVTFKNDDKLVIMNLGYTSSWIPFGLAFQASNPVFLGTLQIEKFPGQPFSLACDFETFRELKDFMNIHKDLSHRISRIIVDLPPNFADLEISTFEFKELYWHCTTPETGSLFLLNRDGLEICKKSATSLRTKNERLQASGPAAKADYLDRPRSTKLINDGEWVTTPYAMTIQNDSVTWHVSPPSLREEPVKDLMKPDWSVDSQPLSRMRLRRGSKNQRYWTNKSQVSAFYRKRYFHRQTMKSRAVVRK